MDHKTSKTETKASGGANFKPAFFMCSAVMWSMPHFVLIRQFLHGVMHLKCHSSCWIITQQYYTRGWAWTSYEPDSDEVRKHHWSIICNYTTITNKMKCIIKMYSCWGVIMLSKLKGFCECASHFHGNTRGWANNWSTTSRLLCVMRPSLPPQ